MPLALTLVGFCRWDPEELLYYLYNGADPTCADRTEIRSSLKFFDEDLNLQQKEAVVNCLAQDQVALIHGPPGKPKNFRTVTKCKAHNLMRMIL